MSDRPQYPSYPGDDDPAAGPDPGRAQQPPQYAQQPPPPQYVQQPPPPPYGQQQPPPYGQQAPAAYGQVPPGYPQPPAPYAPASTKAVFAMVLGIVSILFCYLGLLIGPAAILVSVLATKEIDARPPGTVSGRGMATAGLVTGIVGTVIWALVLALTIIGATVE